MAEATKVSARIGTAKGGPSTGELGSIRHDDAHEVPLGKTGTVADNPAVESPEIRKAKALGNSTHVPTGGATGRDRGGPSHKAEEPGEVAGEGAPSAGGEAGLEGS